MNPSVKSFSVLLVIVALFVFNLSAQAQSHSTHDPGGSEPDHPSYVNLRVGGFFQERGEHERAIEAYTIAIDSMADFWPGYAARGDSYAALGEWDLAISDYDAALIIAPDLVSALYMRGRAYEALGEPTLAQADFENAIAQLPDFALPYFGLGDLLYAQGEYAEALAHYQSYLQWLEGAPDELVMERVAQLVSQVS
jgi:tetratricopeptide (TPR) repeat protein